MSGRLSDEQMDQLKDWIGTGPKQFSLLYAITRDGCGPAQFHKMCDNQGPTVTVIYNTQGSVFGAYTSIAWESTSESWKRDDLAFIFQLVFSNKKLYRHFPSNKTTNTVYHGARNGLLFGNGGNYDFHLFHGQTVNAVNGVYALAPVNGQMTASSNFVYGSVKSADINNGLMDVVEAEVYRVTGMNEDTHTCILHQ